jgi:hypothetical protein
MPVSIAIPNASDWTPAESWPLDARSHLFSIHPDKLEFAFEHDFQGWVMRFERAKLR